MQLRKEAGSYSVVPNPMLVRLVGRKAEIKLQAELAWMALILGFSIISVPLSIESAVILCLGLPCTVLSLISFTLLPALIAVDSWRITTRYSSDKSDELVTLTSLTSAEILWAYSVAILYRWRVLLRWVIGLMPILTLSMVFTVLLYQVDFDKSHWCITSPLGSHYCQDWDVIEGRERALWELKLVVAGVAVSAAILGISVLATLWGVGITLWSKNMPQAAIGIIAIFSGTCVLWVLLFFELAYSSFLSPPVESIAQVVMHSAMVAVAPYLLIFAGSKLLQRQVYKPS